MLRENGEPLWRLEVLRPQPVIWNGRDEITLGTRGGIALAVALYLMMTRAEATERAELIQVFQGMAGGGPDRSHLRRILHDLRKTFGSGAITGDERVQWQLPITVDAEELLALTPETMPDDTLSLYQGEFLSGWDKLKHAGRFWSWVKERRDQFRRHAFTLLDRRASSVSELGEWERVRAIGRRISTLWPGREEGYRWELEALEQLGLLAEARERYADAERVLSAVSLSFADLGRRLRQQLETRSRRAAGPPLLQEDAATPGTGPALTRPSSAERGTGAEFEPPPTPDSPAALVPSEAVETTRNKVVVGNPSGSGGLARTAARADEETSQSAAGAADRGRMPPELRSVDQPGRRASGVGPRPEPGTTSTAAPRGRRWLGLGALATVLIITIVALPWRRRAGADDGGRSGAGEIPVCRDGAGRAALVREVYHSRHGVDAGSVFHKAWYLKNDGRCSWAKDFLVVRQSPTQPGGPRFSVASDAVRLGTGVLPGDTVLIKIRMQAPDAHAVVYDRWSLLDASAGTVNIDGSPYLPVEMIVRKHPVALCRPEDVVAEVVARYADGRIVAAESDFAASWTLNNPRLCAWPADTQLQRKDPGKGPLSGDTSSVLVGDVVLPGEAVTLRIPMRAPASTGTYGEEWELVTSDGTPRPVAGEPSVWVHIKSVSPGEVAHLGPARCDPSEALAGFVGETIRDSTELPRDQVFEKTWSIRNIGTCRWEAPMVLRFKRSEGARLSLDDEVPVEGVVLPQEPYSFTVPMRAPLKPGVYSEYWELIGPGGEVVAIPNNDEVWVIIRVK